MGPAWTRLREELTSFEVAWRAPGRANLIGEHTDYNGGFVLPVALELDTFVGGRRRGEVVRLRSLDEPGLVDIDVSSGRGVVEGWGRYVAGIVRALQDDSIPVHGFEGVVASDVPIGAGLSSSAALEVAVARAVVDSEVDGVRLARACRRAENHYVGVQSGIMDQLSSVAGRAGHALLIDCADETLEPVAIPDDLVVVVLDSGVRRGLEETGYNQRRSECSAAARALGVSSLRRAGASDLSRLQGVLQARARHVVTENERVLAAAGALRAGELSAIHDLLSASHRSMASDFEASTPEIDALVRLALDTPGVIGARITGGGFGGCTVNLVDASEAGGAARSILERYAGETGRHGRSWISRPADGAGPISV